MAIAPLRPRERATFFCGEPQSRYLNAGPIDFNGIGATVVLGWRVDP
jgi:hypothetical protein